LRRVRIRTTLCRTGIKILSVAAAAKSSAAAIALLDGGADIHIAADKTGNTPLHVAAQNGSLDLVEKLIAKGADVNARTNESKRGRARLGPRGPGGRSTPLLLAARSGHVDVMEALIKAGADT
jgi:ankyrin repeat protein